MKKFFFLFSLLALPLTSWQEFNPSTGVLKVLTGGQGSAICFIGDAKDYEGTCVNPKAPTTAWVWEHRPLK